MRDRRNSRASLTARMEKLADYITRRLTKMDVLVGINQLLCDMARSNKRQSYTVLETPDGLLRLTAEERPQASPRPDMKYYELTATLSDGTSTSGYAVMRKIHPRLDIWELAKALLNVRHPGSGVDIAPCIAGPPRAMPHICVVALSTPLLCDMAVSLNAQLRNLLCQHILHNPRPSRGQGGSLWKYRRRS